MTYSLPMETPRLTIVETASYLADAKKLMTDEERAGVVDMIASDPACGDLIVGGGGVRKVRYAIGSKGKSGGVRVIYYYHSGDYPAFLLMVYPKNVRTDLSADQTYAVAAFAKRMTKTYGANR